MILNKATLEMKIIHYMVASFFKGREYLLEANIGKMKQEKLDWQHSC